MALGAPPSPAPSVEPQSPRPALLDSLVDQQPAAARTGCRPPETPETPTRDYANLVRTLQERSHHRTAANAPTATSSAAAASPLQIEHDLKLAAQIGQTLLSDKAALQAKLDQSERANRNLLERLGAAVKDNNKLERVSAGATPTSARRTGPQNLTCSSAAPCPCCAPPLAAGGIA